MCTKSGSPLWEEASLEGKWWQFCSMRAYSGSRGVA
jgi:hypothetical protein